MESRYMVVTQVLREMGVSAQVKGHEALRQAIIMAMDDPTVMRKMTRVLYPKVGEIIHSTPTQTERAMRHAIEMTWNHGDKKGIQNILRIKPDMMNKPSNSRFIAEVADYINVFRIGAVTA